MSDRKRNKQTRPGEAPQGIFERRDEQVVSFYTFLGRMMRSLVATLVIITISLGWGTAGYCYFGDMPWDDGVLNASMILTGMGPVNPMQTTAGKLFASFYALYSGLAFLTMTAIIIAPVYHRFLHHFHLDEEDQASN